MIEVVVVVVEMVRREPSDTSPELDYRFGQPGLARE